MVFATIGARVDAILSHLPRERLLRLSCEDDWYTRWASCDESKCGASIRHRATGATLESATDQPEPDQGYLRTQSMDGEIPAQVMDEVCVLLRSNLCTLTVRRGRG